MRNASWWLAGSLAVVALGCSGGSNSPLDPTGANGPSNPAPAGTTDFSVGTGLGGRAFEADIATSALGIFTFEVDTTSLTATSHLKASRSGQATDDIYDLSIENFVTPSTVGIQSVGLTPTTVDITYSVTHPFAAPSNLAGPATAANRADLGISGRVLFLLDAAAATGNTYFTDVIAETDLMTNPDGYYEPKGLLTLTGFVSNTFPYMALVDETQDPRTSSSSGNAIANGGNVKGNYSATTGWQQSNIGANRDSWTGYGVMHQGQTVSNTISIDRAILAGGGAFSFDTAIIAKYADPRGGANAAAKKANRLPGATADVTKFVYREPHGALDVESVEFVSMDGQYLPNQLSAATLRFKVADWDATSTETSQTDLALDTVPTNVAIGEAGAPDLAISIPGVTGDATSSVALVEPPDADDSAHGGDAAADSGVPGDELFYEELVQKNVISGQTPGTYKGMVRATDPEMGLTTDWHFSLNPSLAPLSGAQIPDPVVYASFEVVQAIPNDAPSLTLTTPANVPSGATTSISVTAASDTELDPITIEIDWDDNGSYEDSQVINSPYGTPTLNRPGATPYVNPNPTPEARDIPVRFRDTLNPFVDYAPALTFTLGPNCSGAMAGTNVTAATLTTGNVLRTGTAADQPITGLRLTWADGADSSSHYSIQRAAWAGGAALPTVFTQIVEIANPAGSPNNYDHAVSTVDAGGTRWVYRIVGRCSAGGADGSASHFVVAAFQNFEGALSPPLFSNFVGDTGGGWLSNRDEPTYGISYSVGPPDALFGTKSFELNRTYDFFQWGWSTVTTPAVTPGDFATIKPSIAVMRFEGMMRRIGTFPNAAEGGAMLLTRAGAPTNGCGDCFNPIPAGTSRWVPNTGFITGQNYTTSAAAAGFDSHAGIAGLHPAGQVYRWDNSMPGTETYFAFDAASVALTANDTVACFTMVDYGSGSGARLHLDDAAYLWY